MFTVIWTIDIDAETPEEAAQKALEIQRDPESSATVFDVYLYPNMQAKTVIDLDNDNPPRELPCTCDANPESIDNCERHGNND